MGVWQALLFFDAPNHRFSVVAADDQVNDARPAGYMVQPYEHLVEGGADRCGHPDAARADSRRRRSAGHFRRRPGLRRLPHRAIRCLEGLAPCAGNAESHQSTVLGDFANASLEHFGVTTTFFRNGDEFMVRIGGPDGALHDYPVAYTFGVYPLQQYLIAFPGGRLQALGVAWDSRAKGQGGQRWFHLYPGQQLKPGHPLHWTGRDQTWNYQCADCHSTDLKKNYDLAANTYATSWTDLDVGCEACHGPGSQHVAWAKAHAAGGTYPSGTDASRMGLTNWLKPTDAGYWEMNPETGIARRTEKLLSTELETCAACHSRRKVIAKDPVPGEPYLDAYLPALLEPGLYHADGQIDGEVYEYGSFLQSRMHAAGVTCSNCHDPHSAKLRAA